MAGDGFHLRHWHLHSHAEVNLNRCQSMSTIEGSVTSLRLSATARSGGKRQRNAATPRGERITRHVRLENGSERRGLTDAQGEQVVEALPLASGSVAVWMSIQS